MTFRLTAFNTVLLASTLLLPQLLLAQAQQYFTPAYPVVWVEQGGPYSPGQPVTIGAYVDANPPGSNNDEDATTYNEWGIILGTFALSDNGTNLGSYSSISSYSVYDEQTCYDEYQDPYPCEMEITFNLYQWSVVLSPGSHTFTMNWSGGLAYEPPAYYADLYWPPVSGSTSLSVPLASLSLSVSASPSSFTYGSNTTFTATLSGGYNPAGSVIFYVDGNSFGSAGISGSTATLGAGSSWTAGNHTITASYSGDGNNNSASASGYGITIAKATPTITWSNPSPITYGTALSSTQLNVSFSTPGSCVYNPAASTVLAAGTRTLSVTCTPSDTTDYNSASGNVSLTVNAASLSITANNDSKTYGQTKSYGSGSSAFTSSGLQNGETIGSVTITASGGTAGNAPVGSYSLTPSAATGGTFTASNYSITYHAGALTVNAASLSITANNDSKTMARRRAMEPVQPRSPVQACRMARPSVR